MFRRERFTEVLEFTYLGKHLCVSTSTDTLVNATQDNNIT